MFEKIENKTIINFVSNMYFFLKLLFIDIKKLNKEIRL